jgi:polar amino acid transport system permease protein
MSPAGSGTEISALALERESFRRSGTRRSFTISFVSTALVAVLAVLAVRSSPGWPRVHQSFFDASVARSSFLPVLGGLWLNIRILVVAEILVLALGLLLAVVRTTRGAVLFPLRALATVYTDLFRGLPLIVALYLIGFGLPALSLQGIPKSPTLLGATAIVLAYSAYVGEVFRAGIEGVHPSQRLAARSLGLSHRQSLRLVILPQAVRRVVPPLLNDFVGLQKDVGLVSVLGVPDAIQRAMIAESASFNFTPYVVAGLLFIALAVPTGRIADAVARRASRREQSGSLL